MNKTTRKCLSTALVACFILDPVTLSFCHAFSPTFGASRLFSSRPVQGLFDQEALSLAAEAWTPDGLGSRVVPARVRHWIAHRSPNQLIFGAGLTGSVLILVVHAISPKAVSSGLSMLIVGMLLNGMPSWAPSHDPNKSEDRRRRDLFVEAWDLLWTRTNHATRESRYFAASASTNFMAYKYGAPRFLPGLQNVSYQIAGQILYEYVQKQPEGLADGEQLKRALQQAEAVVAAVQHLWPIKKRFQVGTDEEDRFGNYSDEYHEFPAPAFLKPLLIMIQTGELEVPPPFADPSRGYETYQRQVADMIQQKIQGRDLMHEQEIQQELEEEFPRTLPVDQLKQVLRKRLLRMAEHPSQFFEVRKINAVLDRLDLSKLTGEQVRIVDPYSFQPESQSEAALGVIPREVAEAVGACQLSLSVFVLLEDGERPYKRKIAFIIQADHKRVDKTRLTYVPVGGKAYVPGEEDEKQLERRTRRQLRFPKDYPLKGTWEPVKVVYAPVSGHVPTFTWLIGYEADSIERMVFPDDIYDVRLTKTFMYHPTPEEREIILVNSQHIEDLKKDHSGPVAFEEKLKEQWLEGRISRWDARAIVILLASDVFAQVDTMFSETPDPSLPARKVYHTLVETYTDPKTNQPVTLESKVYPDPELIGDLIRHDEIQTPPVRWRLENGQVHSEDYYESNLEKLKSLRASGRVYPFHPHLNFMQSRYEAAHGRNGIFTEVWADVAEEFRRWVGGESLTRWVRGHERIHVLGLGWIDRQHPMYPAARRAVIRAGVIIRRLIAPLPIGPYGRFVLASVVHFWLSTVLTRIPVSIPSRNTIRITTAA